MTVVIVRLDLDKYDALVLSRFVVEGVITIGEACDAKAIKGMSELHQLIWVRQVKGMMPHHTKKAG